MLKKYSIYFFILFIVSPVCGAFARQIVDMADRRVDVPDKISKVYGTTPVSTHTVYVMDPGLVAALNTPLNMEQKPYLDARLQSLPVAGNWGGQGQACNLETLLKVQPDIALVWVWQRSSINDREEKALKPLGIPIVYIIMESIEEYPAVFRFLGELFNKQKRAQELSCYAENVISEAARIRASVAKDKRVPVYYAEGSDGLNTESESSVHAQLIPLSGGLNVHRGGSSSHYGMLKISMEQVLMYDPEVIVSHEPHFFEIIKTDPKWKDIRAVKNGRVYRIPRAPLNWFDRPPSCMRFLGLKWMMNRLYPQAYPVDMIAEVRNFCRLFLNVNLSDADIRKLLQS